MAYARWSLDEKCVAQSVTLFLQRMTVILLHSSGDKWSTVTLSDVKWMTCLISHSSVVQKSSHSGDWVLYVKLWQQFLFENDHGQPQVCSQGMGLMSDASAQRTTSTSTTTGRRGRLLSSTSSPFDWESFNSLSPSPFSAKVRSSLPIFSHHKSDLRKAH